MVRLVIVDDHRLVRVGIRHLLQQVEQVEVIGEACDGAEALLVVEQLQPDVLLLDMMMPQMDGIEVSQRLRDANSNVRVLILTQFGDVQFLRKAIRAGVSGYLLKTTPQEVLASAILAVARGELYIDPILTSALRRDLSVAADEPEDETSTDASEKT